MPENKIYDSPDVQHVESRAGLAAPFQEDNRGSITRLTVSGTNLTLIFTRAGFMRGGEIHKVAQHNVIISGRLELWIREGDKDVIRAYGKNELVDVPADTPHLFNFLEDTLIGEWLDGQFETWYYLPYRNLIKTRV